MKTAQQQALRFLDSLETSEAHLLSWGLVDGAFSEDEILDRVEDYLEELEQRGLDLKFHTGEDLIEWLLEAKLLWELPIYDDRGVRYRSRMAEGVRLFSRLRQMFSGDGWRNGPSLVADYRLNLRPRVFPRRDIPPEEVEEGLSLSEAQLRVLRSFLTPDGSEGLNLSRFQVQATQAVLEELDRGKIGATLVSAGTASGKSLAFFLPAFLFLTETPPATKHPHVLAIYPRIELLKDQLKGTLAFSETVEAQIESSRGAGISVAAFYRDLPSKAEDLLHPRFQNEWRRIPGKGFVCPFLVCPRCQQSDLIWREEDLRSGRERLTCASGTCDGRLESHQIRLTRDSMARNPPDILFTTTEMLNRQMSSERYRHLFGVRTASAPRLVLLDEVHTYGGVSGAQFAFLLRRWRHLSGAWPHFVGLSATLAEARRFMAELTGVFENSVRVIEPSASELDREGLEYSLALRGDPVSRTALLSTTIQAAMLLVRIMDDRDHPATQGHIYGRRVFAFTDNLDVTNRLFDGLRDAEGYWSNGPNRRGFGSLANLRESSIPPVSARWEEGQAWTLCEDIGHVLTAGARSRVGRTSSQDTGVDKSVPVVVATSALEVGFDDPDCGGVIQHKAPPDPAGFIQRRGRAGRGRSMRPWTVVVLSDYGRDRLAYQGYERLFSPLVSPRRLPLANRYVLKIQAGFVLIDWLVRQVPAGMHAEGWRDLAGPSASEARRQIYIRSLIGLLEDRTLREEFSLFLAKALGLEHDAVHPVLWDSPRSLLLEVIPTLLRRLESGWKTIEGGSELDPDEPFPTPLPEFVTPNLFSDLNLREVSVVLPGGEEKRMGLRHALSEFSPGKVSKRFAVEVGHVSHWVPIPEDGIEVVDLSDFVDPADVIELGAFPIPEEGEGNSVSLVSPRRIKVAKTPNHVLDTSNSFLTWRHHIGEIAPGRTVEVPSNSSWQDLVRGMTFFSHQRGNPVETRRLADRVSASTRLRGGDSDERELTLVRTVEGDVTPVGLGFTTVSDGMRIDLSIPPSLHQSFSRDHRLLRGLRTGLFRHRVGSDRRLEGLANSFERQWVSDIFLSWLTFNALDNRVSIQDAVGRIHRGDFRLSLPEVLRVLFRAPIREPDDEGLEEGREQRERLYERIEHLLEDDLCRSALVDAAAALWEEPDPSWDPWLHRRVVESIAAAFLGACHRICDGIDPGDLLIDLADFGPFNPAKEDGARLELNRIWLTEAIPGGAGFIEEIQNAVVGNRHRFLALVEAELAPSDFEQADHALQSLLGWLADEDGSGSNGLSEIISGIREASTHGELAAAFRELRVQLSHRGLSVNRAFLAAVNLRLLRPGTSKASDELLGHLISTWAQMEDELGIEVDGRVFSYWASGDPQFDLSFENIANLPIGEDRRVWRFDNLLSLLWPRGSAVREEALEYYNPFSRRPNCDRLLVNLLIPDDRRRISAQTKDWLEGLVGALLADGQAVLEAPASELDSLKSALLTLVSEPVDTGPLLLFPLIRGVSREGDLVQVQVELPEYFS